MPSLAVGQTREGNDIDIFVGVKSGIVLYFYLNRCQPTPVCNGRGICEFSSLRNSSCNCADRMSAAGPQCESCVEGTIEVLYKDGINLHFANPPDCHQCPSGYWSDLTEYAPDAMCNQCQSGYFDDSSGGGTSIDVCKTCPKGYVQPEK